MGIDFCINCSKKEDEKEDKEKQISPKNKDIQMIIGDSKGKLVVPKVKEKVKKNNLKISTKDLLKSSISFSNILYKDPYTDYKKEDSKNLPENVIKVSIIKSPEIFRLMRIIDTKDIMDEEKKRFLKEDIKSLKILDHTNIHKIYEIYIFNNIFYIIYNIIEGDIIEKIKNVGLDDESIIKTIMNQLFNALDYLHKNELFNIGLNFDQIVITLINLNTKKRKIKKGKKKDNPEKKDNIIIKKKYEIYLSILGILDENYEESNLEHLKFYSPEIVEQINNEEMKKKIDDEDRTDEWACGIIMYYLVCGELPFNGDSKEKIFEQIKNTKHDISSEKFKALSNSCVDLISQLLEKDKNKRISIKECLEHPFITGENVIITKSLEEENDEIDTDILKQLLQIKKSKTKFHEYINGYLSFNFLDKEEQLKLTEVFQYIDQDHDNFITEENIKTAFEKNKINYTEEEIENILNVFDYDQNNLIQYQEFLKVLCNKKKLFNVQNLQNVFNKIDVDNTQYIDIKNLQQFIPDDNERIKEMIKNEFDNPFGMKEEDKMIFEQFREVIQKDKIYPEVIISEISEKNNIDIDKDEEQ